ncbi:hypothetical protein [Massilia sp. TS11]|uniref:hypothetical protein n=1 Tax=Massilia sp. TS11 TaxID=2908003 RepID=UPI001EDB04A2|nr:hypothetical protein [Massilia sp. TS11]MCG2586175.1 hypothetical protein [Massilia sp. TS11]
MRVLLVCLFLLAAPASAHLYSGLISERRFAEVEQALRQRLAQDPRDAAALAASVELALAKAAPGYVAEAMRYADLCIQSQARNAECHLARARVLVARRDSGGWLARQRDTRAALSEFAQAIAYDTRLFPARVGLARLQLDSPWLLGGGTSRARAQAIDSGRLNPDVSNLIQAWCDLDEGREAKAEELALTLDLTGAEAVIQDQADLLWALGQTYLDGGRAADARRVFGELRRRFPAQGRGYFGLGLVEQASGQHAAALALFNNALAVQPRPEVWSAVSVSAQAVGDRLRAIQALEQALRVPADWPRGQRDQAAARLRELKGP